MISKSKIFSANPDECKTKGGPDPDKPCVFPFIFNGSMYNECPTVKYDQPYQPWCSTEVDSNGHYISGKWGFCDRNCFSGRNIKC